MIKKFSLLFLLTSTYFAGFSQANDEDYLIGKNYFIRSVSLDEERKVSVYTPPSYDSLNKSYPVLYVLDGQRYFLHAASLSQSFLHYDQTPEFIIVGIDNRYPQRFNHFYNGRTAFLSFLKDELIPFIEENFRVSDERMLFGWEYGASFTFYTLTTRPELFDSYFMASPYPIENQIGEVSNVGHLDKNLVFGVSPDEYQVNFSVAKLDSALNALESSELEWLNIDLLNDEHRFTGYPVLYQGLKFHFKFYPELEVNNLYKFLDAGDLTYAHQYNKTRAQLYGLPEALSTWSKFTIVRSAMRAEEFTQFERLLSELGKEQLLNELLDQRPFSLSSIASFYEQNNQFEESIPIYELLIEKYPESTRLLRRMGAAKEAIGKVKEAKHYYRKADMLEKKNE